MAKLQKVAAEPKADTTVEQNNNIAELNAAHAPAEAKAAEPTIEELKAAEIEAKKAFFAASEAAGWNDTPETLAAEAAYKKARAAVKQAEAAEAKAAAEKQLSEKMQHATEEVSSVIPSDVIDAIKAAIAAENSTFLTSFGLIFGKKPVVAREGQSGKSLTGGRSGNPESLSARARALFDQGFDVAQVTEQLGVERKKINDIHWGWKKAQG